LNQVSRVIDAVQRSPAGQNTVIIVHGDHGSRINDVEPFAENIGKFGDETLLAGYSTLFAVRGPNLTPGYDSQHYPVTQLLQELAASKFEKTASHPDPHPAVILLDRKLSPRRVEALPRHW
jgi:arylsulfatase A-like enzyme